MEVELERKLVAQDPGAVGAAGEDPGEVGGGGRLWFTTDAAAELPAGRAGQGERVGPAVAPGPLGDDVRDDPAVVLRGQLRRDARRPGDVEPVHPHVTGEAHVEEVADRLPAD